jgi:hypothetical protein
MTCVKISLSTAATPTTSTHCAGRSSLPSFRVTFALVTTTKIGHAMPHHRSPNKQPKLPRLHERLQVENRHDSDHETTSDSRTDSHATRESTTPSFTRSSNTVELMLSPPTVDVAVVPESSWEAPSPVSNPSPREADGKRKRPRFLGDIDRRMIIQRLANGEKQADLAREFGVTRAAICHINKNRDEILTRFDILAKSPQGRYVLSEISHTG